MKTTKILHTCCLLLGLLLLGGQTLQAQNTRMVQVANEIVRINPQKANQIDYSTNGGRTWMSRYTGTSCGKFLSLMDNGKELLAQTEKGLYYSTNSGRTWMRR